MDAIASQITNLTIIYSTVYSDADQIKHQSYASLAFVRGIHRGPVNSPHKWPVTRKMFPFDDVIMHMKKTSGPQTVGMLNDDGVYSLGSLPNAKHCSSQLAMPAAGRQRCKHWCYIDWLQHTGQFNTTEGYGRDYTNPDIQRNQRASNLSHSK